MRYPAHLEPAEDGGFVVTFRDIPEAITQGDSAEESLNMAEDALLTAMDFYFDDNRPVPIPSKPEAGEYLVELPASIWTKVLLLNEMLEQKVSQTDLANRLETSPQSIHRVVNLRHPTKIDSLDQAFKALGKELQIMVVSARNPRTGQTVKIGRTGRRAKKTIKQVA